MFYFFNIRYKNYKNKIIFKNKFLNKIVLFQNFNYIFGFYFYKFIYSSGVIIHLSLGIINNIFFKKTPKKKNIKIINKLYVYLINKCLVKVYMQNSIKKNSIINKSFFKIKNINNMLVNLKKLKRLNKKKRSLKRKSRKKIFTSLFGRI
jgi:hypothetical protein